VDECAAGPPSATGAWLELNAYKFQPGKEETAVAYACVCVCVRVGVCVCVYACVFALIHISKTRSQKIDQCTRFTSHSIKSVQTKGVYTFIYFLMIV